MAHIPPSCKSTCLVFVPCRLCGPLCRREIYSAPWHPVPLTARLSEVRSFARFVVMLSLTSVIAPYSLHWFFRATQGALSQNIETNRKRRARPFDGMVKQLAGGCKRLLLYLHYNYAKVVVCHKGHRQAKIKLCGILNSKYYVIATYL
jgi:hypothetical protein